MESMQSLWPWYIAGPLISIVLFLLLYWGKTFGVSGNYRTICSIMGGGKSAKFFDFDWKKERWNLAFIVGVALGAFLTSQFLPNGQVELADQTVIELTELGVSVEGELAPPEIFGIEQLFSLRSMVFLALGGFLVGFGSRYAGGCTSGHAITGLSDLQLPSLIAVIGFFLGGLLVTYFLLPTLINL